MRSRYMVVLAAMVLGVAGCGRLGDDTLLARVGKTNITVGDFKRAFHDMPAGERPPLETLDQKQTFLKDLVDKELMEQAAFEQYPELNERQKKRYDRTYNSEILNRVEEMLVRNQIHITKQMKDQLWDDFQRERHVFGLLIVDTAEAAYVVKRLAAGDDFGKLARDHSASWVGEGIPGDMGWVMAASMAWPLHRAVWDAKLGDTVGPITLPMGTYIFRPVEERPATRPPGTREGLDEKLEVRILQELYLNRQKSVQDSLRAAENVAYTSGGTALLMTKFYWEPPPEYAQDPMARLNAPRYAPTYTQEESTTVVVDFATLPDWTAGEFTRRLKDYPSGLWPTGQSEEDLQDILNMMVRDYLKLETAKTLGVLNDPVFKKKMEVKAREMRVTYFYFNDVLALTTPNPSDIDEFFRQNRDRYKAPPSYKVAFFSSINTGLMDKLAADWKGGAPFVDVRGRYEKQDPKLIAVGETGWLYEGRDLTLDNLVRELRAGGISDPMTRSDTTTVFQVVVKREGRLVGYEEIKEQVDKDAKSAVADKRLDAILDQQRKKVGVTLKEGALKKLKLPGGAIAATG